MDAATATNTIIKGLSHVQRGKDVTYQATWLVECTAPVPGYVAQTLAQITTPNQMPIYGAPLSLITGGGIVTDVLDQYEDSSVFALDFTATEAIPGESLNWNIVVGWRKPADSNQEDPGSASQKPLARPPRYRMEYRNSTEEITRGRLVTVFTPGADDFPKFGTEQTMKNTALEPFPIIERDILRPVLVISRNVKSPLVALDINGKFENTTNSKDFSVTFKVGTKNFPFTIKKYQARFLIAEVSETNHEQSQAFVKQELRIEISKRPYFFFRFNEGNPLTNKFVIDGVNLAKIPRASDGTPIPGPHALNTEGKLATKESDKFARAFLVLDDIDYNILK